MSKSNLPSMCQGDIIVDGNRYRFHSNHDEYIIKIQTKGDGADNGGVGYGGWAFVSKFQHSDKERALEEWRDLYNRRYVTVPDAAIEVVEGEMVAVESSNFDRIEVSTVVETSITKAIKLADFSKQCAKVSVICAAAAGAEFSAIKDQCERGEWMKVLKILPFGKDTVYKYIKIADELQARLSEGGDPFDLLQLPDPSELVSGQHDDVIEKINQATGEQSLRQLYFEWGILKQPKALGGARPVTDHTPKELVELRKQDANESVGALCTDLQKVCIGESRSVNLADIEFLKLLEGDLIDSLKNVRELINAG